MANHGQADVAVESHGELALHLTLNHEAIGRIEEIVMTGEASVWMDGDMLVRRERSTIVAGQRIFGCGPDGSISLYLVPASAAGWTIKLENAPSPRILKGPKGVGRNLRIALKLGSYGELRRGDVQLFFKVVTFEAEEAPTPSPTALVTAPSLALPDTTEIEPDELPLNSLARWMSSLLHLLRS